MKKLFSGLMLTLLMLSLFALTSNINFVNANNTPIKKIYVPQFPQGPNIDIFTQRGGKGDSVPSDSFGPKEKVIIYANLTYNGGPIPEGHVTFEIRGPNDISLTCVDNTNETGIATTSFRLPWLEPNPEEAFGVWKVWTTAYEADIVVSDTLEFEYGWLVELLSLETGVTSNGEWFTKTVFYQLDSIEAIVNLKSIVFNPKNICLTFLITDSSDTPIIYKEKQHLTQGKGIESLSIDLGKIPLEASVGIGILFINALTRPPLGGIAYCPEIAQSIEILSTSLNVDVNRDGITNVLDLILVARQMGWTGQPGAITEDINEDGKVNLVDLMLVADNLRT